MELKLAVNNDCVELVNQLKQHIEEKCPFVTVEYFNEDIYKEKQKSYKLKGGYGARQVPFALLYDDINKIPIKAFYTEDNSCTFNIIINTLNNFILYGEKEKI